MVEFATERARLRCVFKGRMDTAEAMRLENQVDISVRQAKKPVAFDLSGVDYVSSSFIRICVMAVQAVGKENFAIIGAPVAVAKIFNVAGLEEFLR